MSLNTRQLCSTRNVFRGIMGIIVLLVIVLIYRSSTIPKNSYCNSSTDCYNLIREKAAERFLLHPSPPSLDQQREQIQEQDNAFKAMYEDNSEQKQEMAMGVDMEQVIEKDEKALMAEKLTMKQKQEYKVLTDASLPRVKGAFVVLARNSELYALRSSMRYLEDRFNKKYNYPWIFLNEQPFTEEFKNMTRMMTNAEVHYGLVPQEHWSYPDWIDQEYAAECRQDLADRNIHPKINQRSKCFF